jgi:uroporphyrinogen-III synthase
MTTVVVTRPAREADAWVQSLREAGWDAVALPLIDIGGPPDPQALGEVRSRWHQYDAAMFVSPQAVEHFFGESDWQDHGPTRLWAPGPGTARALVRRGVPADRIDQPAADAAQFDSEVLWTQVARQITPGHRLLVVRGISVVQPDSGAHPASGNGRDWLAARCQDAGGQVDWCVAYQRQLPSWGGDQRALVARFRMGQAIWLFSSSEAVRNLGLLCPRVDWSLARALATHERVAQALRVLGFAETVCTRPAVGDVLQGLESMT